MFELHVILYRNIVCFYIKLTGLSNSIVFVFFALGRLLLRIQSGNTLTSSTFNKATISLAACFSIFCRSSIMFTQNSVTLQI